jgi:hypothetical protein
VAGTISISSVLIIVFTIALAVGKASTVQNMDGVAKTITTADAAFENYDFKKALPLYLAALETGFRSTKLYARIAACYAQTAGKNKAFFYINRAIETGKDLESLDSITGDNNFATLESDVRWFAVLRKYLEAWDPYLKNVGGNKLRLELLKMQVEDQIFRFALTSQKRLPAKGKFKSKEISRLLTDLNGTDEKNTKRMKEIVTQFGWPGKSLVDKDGAAAAWLLVQHADEDLAFQKQCLEMMKPLLENGEIDKKHFAYLTDRVLVAEEKPQLYGTQFVRKNNLLIPAPIDDEANVDQRRREMNLEPLDDYKKILQGAFGSPAKPIRRRK